MISYSYAFTSLRADPLNLVISTLYAIRGPAAPQASFHKKGFALSLVLEVIVFLALENGLSDSSTFRKRL